MEVASGSFTEPFVAFDEAVRDARERCFRCFTESSSGAGGGPRHSAVWVNS
jgi:hypothetical protein